MIALAHGGAPAGFVLGTVGMPCGSWPAWLARILCHCVAPAAVARSNPVPSNPPAGTLR